MTHWTDSASKTSTHLLEERVAMLSRRTTTQPMPVNVVAWSCREVAGHVDRKKLLHGDSVGHVA